MSHRTATPRPLRRLRRVLALLALATAALVAVACRFEAGARAVAAVAAVVCLVIWLAVLEAEGRVADRLESQARRRGTSRRAARPPVRARSGEPRRRRAA